MEVYQTNSYANILKSFNSFSSGLEQIIGLLGKFEVNDSTVDNSSYFDDDDIDFPDITQKHSSENDR